MIFQIWNLPTFRDIKGANIFLTDDMKNLKLGDYGSAVKIKQHTTMPGELQGHVGTQGGHGPLPQNAKISDINSENCCVNATHEARATYRQSQSQTQSLFCSLIVSVCDHGMSVSCH